MTERTRNWLLTGILAAALGAWIALGWAQRERFSLVQPGDVAPPFAAPALTGDTVRLEDLRGRVVLLNVWATWCAPCRWEMPALERLSAELAPQGLAVLAVSVDAPLGGVDALGNPGGDVRAFVAELGLTFTVLLDPRAQIQRRYGVTGLPTTFLIGRDGRVVRKVFGPARWDEPPHSADIRALLRS
ncbi:MAG: TlpA family protein disulfide reductase [Gemmatimonadetes bacterium]|nr:TlpA family protein disulfide reductase [Gemmatimonadota bacterium]